MSKSGHESSTSNTNQTTNSTANVSGQNQSVNASNTTMTPTNPQFVTDSVTGLQDKINGLLNTDPSSLVAGPSSLQLQAFNGATNLGQWQPAAGLGVAGANSILQAPPSAVASASPTLASSGTLLNTDLGAYQNPYLKDVVNTTLSDFDQNAAQTRAAQTLAQAQAQKFGGSRSALTSALTEDQLARARAAADAQLRSQAFDTATANATNDLNRSADTSRLNAQLGTQASLFSAGAANDATQADRQRTLAAAGLLGDLSNGIGANQRGDVGLLASEGDTQRGITQQQLGAPASLLQLISNLNSAQPYSLFRGIDTNELGASSGSSSGTTNSTSNTQGTTNSSGSSSESGLDGVDFAKLVTAAIMASDKRLKTGIRTIGKDGHGRRVVDFRYKGEPKGVHRTGYIAQEVEKTDPHAVITAPSGYKYVNYGLLGMGAA